MPLSSVGGCRYSSKSYFYADLLVYNWNRAIDRSCADLSAAYLAAGILNLLSDVSVLMLPISVVLNLHLPLRSRIVLMATFCIGLLYVECSLFLASPLMTFSA